MELNQLYGETVRECMAKIQQKIGKEDLLAYLEKHRCELMDTSEDELSNRLRLAMAFHWELRRLNLAYIQEGVDIYFKILRFCLRRANEQPQLFNDYELSVLLDELGRLFSRRILLRKWDAEAEINAILFEVEGKTLKLRDIYRRLPYLSIFVDKWFPPRYAVPVYQAVLKQGEWDKEPQEALSFALDSSKQNLNPVLTSTRQTTEPSPPAQEDDVRKVANAVKRLERNRHIRIGIILLAMLLSLGLSKFLPYIPYLSAILLAVIIILLIITMVVLARGNAYLLKRFVPRLTACTVVGYVPLLLVSDAWGFALNLDMTNLLLVCFGALLGGWGYLFIGMFQKIVYILADVMSNE